jgi:nucleoside-diphosphate-sugar epimerase
MILVTGGAGFIGRAVCRLLCARGHAVLAVDRNALAGLSYPVEQGDIRASDFLAQLFGTHTFSAVVHLASLRKTESERHPDEAMRVNVGAALALLELAARHGVKRFIYGSSISAYGPKPRATHGDVSEVEPASPDGIYGLCKRYVEIAGEQYRNRCKLDFVALRIAMVVGPGVESAASRWRGEIFERLRAEQPVVIPVPFAPAEYVPLIHVDDVAEIASHLVEAPHTQHAIYNTPALNMTCGELAAEVGAANPRVRLAFSSAGARSDPEAIDGRRFAQEFGFELFPLRERLQDALKSAAGS